jgi:hypothetical protein
VSRRPLASVSLDLDNQWSYMKTHGDPGWESLPSYLDVFVPHVLGALDTLGLRITFFIVGQDAALERNRDALRAICERGHELGNHSFHHEQGIEFMARDRVRREVHETTEAIVRATGHEPRGYRGPGFSWNRDLLEILVEAGYLYDASTLPTYLGPIARFYYFRTASISREEMESRRNLFGGFRDGLRPVKPYRWNLGGGKSLLEIPVTTIPGIKTPFHLSYLLYLSKYSTALMAAYLDTALRLCRLTGTEPSFLLHPLDLIGPEQAPALAFFPGMDVSGERKLLVFHRVLSEIGKRFMIVNMSTHAQEILRREPPLREVDARHADAAA